MNLPGPRIPAGRAIDLAALAAQREAQAAAEQRRGDGPVVVFDVQEINFQTEVLNRSATVPVILDLWSPRSPQCAALTQILEKLAYEADGAWVLAKIEVDTNPRIAQALQLQAVPTVIAVVNGELVPMFEGPMPEPSIRQLLAQLMVIAQEAGLNTTAAPAAEVGEADAEDSRYDVAFAAIDEGDWDAADAAYRDILATDPNDEDAKLGLAQVELMRRTDGIDPVAVIAEADSSPADLRLASLAADVEVFEGRVEEAFARLIELVRNSVGDEKAAARDHLVGLFNLIGDADPRVIKARTALANALF
ncbi:MAG: tetratricopeptide repeat protein [Actinomycetes bacterium]|jgi:putative thioredoxin